MTIRTSLIITGDSKTAQAAVDQLASGVAKLAAGANGAAAPTKKLDAAIGGVAQAASGAQAATGRLDGALIDNARSAELAAAAQGHVAKAVADAAAASTAAAQSARANEAATGAMARAAELLTGAVNELASAQQHATETARGLADVQRQASDAATRYADNQNKLVAARQADARALDVFRNMLDPAAIAEARLNEQLEIAARLHTQGKLSEEEHLRVKQLLREASVQEASSLGLQRAGYQQLGFQLQDVMVQYQMGTKVSTIFAQQSGQLAGAIQMIAQSAEGGKGKLGALASFLGGPWGIALGVAIPLIAMLASKLTETAEAAQAAELGTSGLADAQSVMGEMFDLASGKIEKQNELLILNARLKAIQLRSEALTDADTAKNAQTASGRIGIGSVLSSAVQTAMSPEDDRAVDTYGTARKRARDAQGYFSAIRSARTDAERTAAGQRALAFSEKADFSGLGIDRKQFQEGIIALASSRAKSAIADLIDKSLDDGKLAEGLRRPDKPKKPKKDRSAEIAARERKQLDEFGDRSTEAIARIDDQYNSAPKDVDRARQATAQLDAIIKDVNERLTTSKNLTADQRKHFEDMARAAGALKPIIQESLSKPIHDMLGDQERQIELGRLQASGRAADADALQLTYQLMDKMGVETEEQLAAELAKRGIRGDEVRQLYDNLALMREQTRELRIQEEIQRSWLGAIDGMRQNLNLTLRDLRTEGPKAFGDFFKRSLDVTDQLFADVVTEKLFGGLFRSLEDQVTGADKVSQAGDKMASAVDRLTASVNRTTGVVEGGVSAFGGETAEGGISSFAQDPNSDQNEIVVEGLKKAFKSGYEGFFNIVKDGLEDVLGGIFGPNGTFSPELAAGLGKALAGAQFGSSISSAIFGAGGQGSQIGSFIGGAIGEKAGEKFLSKGLESVMKGLGDFAGPIGSIVGAIGGSLLGGLFKPKPGLGATVITSVDGKDAGAWGRKGQLENSTAAGDAVQDNLKKIISALGGVAGAFSVGIGSVEYQGQTHYRVSASGRYDVGSANYWDQNAGGDGIYSGTSADEAVRVAIMNAIADGAVQGLSSAVAKALNSSDDLDAALTTALKVRDLEDSLGGVAGEMSKSFRALEAEAAERLKLARDFGLDVVAVEKKNAEDRAALVKKMAEDQVGSLQRLIDDMTTGSQFEGSAVEHRTALLDAIGKARTDLDAGVEGAADVLANLYGQLNSVSKDAFGTTGRYAADRSSILDQARAAIAANNARIEAAAGATSDPALTQTNQALDENNDQNATLIALMQSLPAEIAAALATGSKTITLDVAKLAATS